MMDTLMNLVSTTLQYFTSQNILIVLGILFAVSFVAVMVCKPAERWVGRGLGLSGKNRILTFLGFGIGGILAVMQVVALSGAVNEQARANHNTEQGQRQERLKNAIEHLGHASDSVRLGGAYELFRLAIDNEDLRRTVWDILCAHIRLMTSEEEYQGKYRSKPSEEIQSLLTLLFVQKYEIFGGTHIDLQESWLNGADLKGARLHKASLQRVWLQGARLDVAHLQGAELYGAQLQEASLWKAHLQGAHFYGAQLQEADLRGAHLQGAGLRNVQLQGADLREAQFQGATLWKAQFQGADLRGAQFQGVENVDKPVEDFEDRMRRLVNKESDLSGVIFADGQSPENSGAITEPPYTAEEAEEWIAEYEEAVPKFPGSDS